MRAVACSTGMRVTPGCRGRARAKVGSIGVKSLKIRLRANATKGRLFKTPRMPQTSRPPTPPNATFTQQQRAISHHRLKEVARDCVRRLSRFAAKRPPASAGLRRGGVARRMPFTQRIQAERCASSSQRLSLVGSTE